MIKSAISTLKRPKGCTQQAICEFIKDKYDVGLSFETHLRIALRKGLLDGSLIQCTGTRVASFKLGKIVSVEDSLPKTGTRRFRLLQKASLKKRAVREPSKRARIPSARTKNFFSKFSRSAKTFMLKKPAVKKLYMKL